MKLYRDQQAGQALYELHACLQRRVHQVLRQTLQVVMMKSNPVASWNMTLLLGEHVCLCLCLRLCVCVSVQHF